MSKIRPKDTKIEVALRKALWAKGYRYRKNYKKVPGSPDICLTKYKIAIFCDGEFFHGKDWEVRKAKVAQGNNGEYWVKKIQENMLRDDVKDKELNALGWTVIHFWGKDILKNTETCISVIEETIFELKMGEMDLDCENSSGEGYE
jgi:DNA mismatch endonuclease (patch repair protein)